MTPPTLKPGWKIVKFGDVVSLNRDRVADPAAEGIERYVGLEHITPEDLRIRRWGRVAEGTTFTNYFQPGQVLFGKRRAYQRKVAVADFSGVCSGDIYVLEPKDPNVLLPELLPFICQTEGFFEHAVGTSAGSLSPRTNWKQLAKYEFPLPPLDEQRRIADLLLAANDVLEKHIALINKTAVIKRIQLDSWLTNHAPNWKQVTLNDVCEIKAGQIDTTQPPYCDMIQIGAEDIESDSGRILNSTTAKHKQIKGGNFMFAENMILYSKIRPYLKKVLVPTFEGVCSIDIFPLLPNENILKELLYQLLLSDTFTRYAISRSTGTAFPRINRKGFLAYKFRLPPKDEQKNIAEKTVSILRALDTANIHLKSSQEFKNNLVTRLLHSSN